MKKQIKTLVFTLVAVALMTLLPRNNVLTVKADGPETYSVAYIAGTYNAWRYQPGSVFDASKGHGTLGELLLKMKEGDSVVVYQVDAAPSGATLDLGSVKLGSLTLYQGTTAVVRTGGVKDCYVLAGANAAINGDVTTAYIYDAANSNFNNNVLDMYLYLSRTPGSNIHCVGTVGYFNASYADNGEYFAAFYDIKANQDVYKDGHFNVPDWAYSSGPSDEYLQAKTSTGAETAQAPSAGQNTSDEYDKVPKTGDNSPVLWLLLASAACFGGSCLLSRKKELCR